MEPNHPIIRTVATVGVMLTAHAMENPMLSEREALEEVFRGVLTAAHVLNIVGPALIQMGADMGLTPEDFDGLALDVATEGAAEGLSPEDFA